MNTRERLEGYWPNFDPDVLDTVAEVTDRQSDYSTYQEFFDAVGVGEPVVFRPNGAKPLSVVDIRPPEHDETYALFVHLPMANPLDPNQRFQLGMLAATNPHNRIVGMGNLSGVGYETGRLSLAEGWQVARGKGLDVLVEGGYQYAEAAGIEMADEAGFSYGALKAVVSATFSPYAVNNTVAIEPVLPTRKFRKLTADFASTAKHLEEYVQAADLPLYEQARADCSTGIKFNLAFVRATNLAITSALGRVAFEEMAGAALVTHDDMHLTVVSGSQSELCLDDAAARIHRTLQRDHSSPDNPRVHAIRLPGQYHALANDPPLHAALVLQSIRAV